MEEKVIPIPVTITGLKTMARSQGVRIQMDTQEIHPEDSAKLFSLQDKQMWAIFKTTKFVQEDLDSLDLPDIKVDKDEKTPSQRLRSVIYVEFEQLDQKKKEIYKTFDNYYRDKMEVIINWIKQKLN